MSKSRFSVFQVNNSSKPSDVSSHDDVSLARTLLQEHAEFVKAKDAYEQWAMNTLLKDVVSPLTGRKFSTLFTVGKGKDGEFTVTFNPTAKNGGTWDKNTSGFVNALLHTFGTLRYSEVRHGYHARAYDPSLPFTSGVLSAYDDVTQKWVRYDSSDHRLVINTPWINPKYPDSEASQKAKAWLSKHVEINRLLMAILGDTSITYHFFGDNNYDEERFKRNVLKNMDTLVSAINVQMNDQSAEAQTVRKINRTSGRTNVPAPTGPIMVDGVDIRTMTDVIRIEIEKTYGSNPITKLVDPTCSGDLAMVAALLSNESTKRVSIVTKQ